MNDFDPDPIGSSTGLRLDAGRYLFRFDRVQSSFQSAEKSGISSDSGIPAPSALEKPKP
jgi:hypothetical protein